MWKWAASILVPSAFLFPCHFLRKKNLETRLAEVVIRGGDIKSNDGIKFSGKM